MPRCSLQKAKLVAEAELLNLPFLAPRVFQPWPCPRGASRSHSTSILGGRNQTAAAAALETDRHALCARVRPGPGWQAVRPRIGCFSTHVRTQDRTRSSSASPSRKADAPKAQNSRSQLAQDWYENAISGLEAQLVDQLDKPWREGAEGQQRQTDQKSDQRSDQKRSARAPATDTRAQRSAHARQREKRSQRSRKTAKRKSACTEQQRLLFLDKSRWTAYTTRSPSTRTKWVHVGHPVRRRKTVPESAESSSVPAGEDTSVPPASELMEDELRYIIPEHSLDWSRMFARLQLSDEAGSALSPDAAGRAIGCNSRAKKWADQILSGDSSTLNVSELERHHGTSWHEIWLHSMLWVLQHRIEDAPRFLLCTHAQSHPPFSWVLDTLQYLANYYSKVEIGVVEARQDEFVNVLCTVLDRPDASRANLPASAIRLVLQRSVRDHSLRLYGCVKSNSCSLHWNTWLHFATSLARSNHFDQALDALLEAAGAGADTRSPQFESNCATILRKAADQPDGLRVSLRIVQNMSDIGVKLNLQLCNSVMLNAVEAGDLKTAFSIYHSLVEHGLQADKYTHAILLKGCKSVIGDSETLNTTIRHAIDDTVISRSDIVATEILHCLYLHHFELNPQTAFSTISEAYAQLFDTTALAKLHILPDRTHETPRMQPTMAALHIMITAYLRRSTRQQPAYIINDTHHLYRHIRMLVNRGVQPWAEISSTDHMANAFLFFFTSHASSLSHAAEVIRDMQAPLTDTDAAAATAKSCKPTVRTWSIFLRGFAKHGKMELAEQVLTYMRDKGIQPNQVTWNTLVGGYVGSRDVDGAVDAFQRMCREGWSGDDITSKALGEIRGGGDGSVDVSRRPAAAARQTRAVAAAEVAEESPPAQQSAQARQGDDGFWDAEADDHAVDAEALVRRDGGLAANMYGLRVY